MEGSDPAREGAARHGDAARDLTEAKPRMESNRGAVENCGELTHPWAQPGRSLAERSGSDAGS